MLKDKPTVRTAIYKAFKGECFYTGRPVPKEDMHIDHLMPTAEGGKDCIENYVLTFTDLNLGKNAKLDDKLLRMQWVVENVYAPRVHKLLRKKKYHFPLKSTTINTETKQIELKQFKGSTNKCPQNARRIIDKDLVWADDKSFTIWTTSELVTEENQHEMIHAIKFCTNVAQENDLDFCFDVWLSREHAIQLKSIWYEVQNRFFRVIHKTKYYDQTKYNRWAWVYFTQNYWDFLAWREEVHGCVETIEEIQDPEKRLIEMRKYCELFPPHESYAHEILS